VGVFLQEKQVELEVAEGPQGPSCGELNQLLEQGKPWCIKYL
jgi:hypothetical protein